MRTKCLCASPGVSARIRVCVCVYLCMYRHFCCRFFLFVVDVKCFLSKSSIIFNIKHEGYLQGNNCFVFIY
jgi:hypothetical protein